MALKNLPGQTRAKRFLKQLVRTGHVPHAVLFSGLGGVGKAPMAGEFARLLNCMAPQDFDSCGECPSCRKFVGGTHPDLIWVKSDGAFIKLDQIRDLRDRLRYRPFEGKWRVVVIQDAQNLREEAGNALLKLLEEPPKQNIFILTVLEPQMLLQTIVSRCCHVRFQPLEDAEVEQHLTRFHQIPSPQAREAARRAGGSLDRALWLAEEDHVSRWKEILAGIQKLDELPMIDFFSLTAQWVKESDALEQDLECIKLWVRELILSRLLIEHQPELELDGRFRSAVRRVSVETLFLLYDRVEQAMQHLRQNANKQLVLEGVCLAIKDGLYGQGHWNSFSQRRQNLSF